MYLLIALVGVAINLAMRVVFDDYLKLGFALSVALGYFCGMIWGFIATKLFAFGERGTATLKTELVKYTLVAGTALVLTVFGSSIALGVLEWSIRQYPDLQSAVVERTRRLHLAFLDRKMAANISGIGLGFFANFFGHKYLTFRSTGALQKIRAKRASLARRRRRKY